jgi:hypothetical protein
MVMDWAHSVFWRDRRGARDAFVSSHFQVPKDSRTFRVLGEASSTARVVPRGSSDRRLRSLHSNALPASSIRTYS